MKKIAENLAAHLAEIIMVGGAVAVTVGVGMLSLPWGCIAGGGLAIAGSVLSLMGREDDAK